MEEVKNEIQLLELLLNTLEEANREEFNIIQENVHGPLIKTLEELHADLEQLKNEFESATTKSRRL